MTLWTLARVESAQRNASATQVHSHLGREGIDPRELPAIGREEVGR